MDQANMAARKELEKTELGAATETMERPKKSSDGNNTIGDEIPQDCSKSNNLHVMEHAKEVTIGHLENPKTEGIEDVGSSNAGDNPRRANNCSPSRSSTGPHEHLPVAGTQALNLTRHSPKELHSSVIRPVLSPDPVVLISHRRLSKVCFQNTAADTQLPSPILPPPDIPGLVLLQHTAADKTAKRSSTPANSSKGLDAGDEKFSPVSLCHTGDNGDEETATFIKNKRNIYVLPPESRLRNNLLASVGFLEFGNATDFAANVWNTVPVPVYAAVLMGLGGAVAIFISLFAIRDGILSWRNIKILREERYTLLRRETVSSIEEGQDLSREEKPTRSTDFTRLEVNRRELIGEVIDRFSMDILMGFGALVVGTGTLMAIGGANPHVYRASNLLSGYIGNSFSLLWGLCNTMWCLVIFRRASRHLKRGLRAIDSAIVTEALRSRVRTVQYHALILGTMTLVSGAGGMLTVTRWWAYIILIPCIMAAIYGNFMWRKKIGYERPLVKQKGRTWTVDQLIKELEWTDSVKDILEDPRQMGLSELVANPTSTSTVVDFIVRCGLFEDFCMRLLVDRAFVARLANETDGIITVITPGMLLGMNMLLSQLLLATAQKCVRERGVQQLRSKERFLLELLGARLCIQY